MAYVRVMGVAHPEHDPERDRVRDPEIARERDHRWRGIYPPSVLRDIVRRPDIVHPVSVLLPTGRQVTVHLDRATCLRMVAAIGRIIRTGVGVGPITTTIGGSGQPPAR